MSAAARAVGNFFGVGSDGQEVIQQWKTLEEKKLKVRSRSSAIISLGFTGQDLFFKIKV